MSGDRYLITDQQEAYFLTLTVIDWVEVLSSAINYADGKGFLMFLEFKINNGVTNANLKRPVANEDEGGICMQQKIITV